LSIPSSRKLLKIERCPLTLNEPSRVRPVFEVLDIEFVV